MVFGECLGGVLGMFWVCVGGVLGMFWKCFGGVLARNNAFFLHIKTSKNINTNRLLQSCIDLIALIRAHI